MRWRLLEIAWNTPWCRTLLIILLVIAAVVWIRDQIKETREGEELRKTDRDKSGSIWKD